MENYHFQRPSIPAAIVQHLAARTIGLLCTNHRVGLPPCVVGLKACVKCVCLDLQLPGLYWYGVKLLESYVGFYQCVEK